mmetsp:Transcript_53638/g.124966  ORF Transcript_53638/g.124966 Transcript_53638/m.124966 type:complete len:200 (-) Transcript_53638:166-765(-)
MSSEECVTCSDFGARSGEGRSLLAAAGAPSLEKRFMRLSMSEAVNKPPILGTTGSGFVADAAGGPGDGSNSCTSSAQVAATAEKSAVSVQGPPGVASAHASTASMTAEWYGTSGVVRSRTAAGDGGAVSPEDKGRYGVTFGGVFGRFSFGRSRADLVVSCSMRARSCSKTAFSSNCSPSLRGALGRWRRGLRSSTSSSM